MVVDEVIIASQYIINYMEWDCTQCGRCCKRWNISIDLEDIENIKKCGYDEREFVDNRKGQLFLKHRGSNCVFLTEDNKCRIQLEHGYEFKPKVCRQFPFDRNNVNTLVCGNVVHLGRSETSSRSSEKRSFSEIPKSFGFRESQKALLSEEIGFKEKTPFVDKGMIFQYGSKIIPPELLLYAISKTDAGNCANSWHAILKGIKASKNRIIEESDIDGALKNPNKISRLQNLRLKIILAGYSRFFFPELALLI